MAFRIARMGMIDGLGQSVLLMANHIGDDPMVEAAKLWGKSVVLVPHDHGAKSQDDQRHFEGWAKTEKERADQAEFQLRTLKAAIAGGEGYSPGLTTAAFAQMARDTEAARKGGLERAELAEAMLKTAIPALQRIEREGGGGRCAEIAGSALIAMGFSHPGQTEKREEP